jgi:hypothetical protein
MKEGLEIVGDAVFVMNLPRDRTAHGVYAGTTDELLERLNNIKTHSGKSFWAVWEPNGYI